MMTKKEKLQFDTLKAQLEAEKEKSEKAIDAYRAMLYEMVDLKVKLSRIEAVMRGEE